MLANISKSISGALSSDGLEQKIDKIQEAEKKNSDKLVHALTDLTKHLKKVEKEQKNQKGKDRPTIGGMIDKAKELKSKFTSLGGIAGMAADHLADKPVLGAIMGSVANKLDQRAENKRKESDFVATVAHGTKFGRQIMEKEGKEGGLKQISTLYKDRSRIENLVEAKKAKQSALKEKGKEAGVEVDLPEAELEDLKKWESQLTKINATIKEGLDPVKEPSEEKPQQKKSGMSDDEADSLRKELIEGIKAGMEEAFSQASPEEKEALQKQHPERMGGIMQGVEDEIMKLNKSQLEELIKLNAQLEGNDAQDKEADLESRIKQLNPPPEKKEEKEEKKSLLGTLLDGAKALFSGPLKSLTGMFGRFIPMISGIAGSIGQLMSGLAPLLGPALAILGAGAAGLAVGKGINSAVEQMTGDTVGGNIHSAVDSFQGSKLGNMLGLKSDEQKMKEADDNAVKELVEKKLKAGEKISPDLAQKAEALGMKIEKSSIINKQENASTDVRRIDNNIEKTENASTDVRRIDNALIEKSDSKMESATHAIESISEELATEKKEDKQVVAPTIVNAPRTVNNTTQNIMRPQIRNPEPQYIKVESRRFAF